VLCSTVRLERVLVAILLVEDEPIRIVLVTICDEREASWFRSGRSNVTSEDACDLIARAGARAVAGDDR
jgi:hypothetical protein